MCVYHQRVARNERSFRQNNEVSPGKIGSRGSFRFAPRDSVDTFIGSPQRRCDRAGRTRRRKKHSAETNFAKLSAGAYLNPANSHPGYSAMATSLHFRHGAQMNERPTALRAGDGEREIFITLIKVYRNDACNV